MITSKSRGKSYAKTENKPSKKHNIISKQKQKQKNPPLPPDGGQSAVGDTWRCSFEIYKNELLAAFNALVRDTAFISEQEQLNPNVDIPRTLQKACKNFWGTRHGWENKKQKPDDKIDWPFTLAGSISQSKNRIYKTNNASQSKQLTTINLNSESELNDLFIAWAHVTEGHYRYRNDATTKYIEKGYTHLISIGQKKYVGRIKQQ